MVFSDFLENGKLYAKEKFMGSSRDLSKIINRMEYNLN